MRIGEKIDKAISEAGLKYEAVAAHADVSVATIRRLLDKDSVETSLLIKISEIVRKPLSYFLQDYLEDERAVYMVAQSGGIGNVGSGGKIKNQKIMQSGKEIPNNEVSEANILELQYKLNLCETEKASLAEKLKLKDEIIELLKNK